MVMKNAAVYSFALFTLTILVQSCTKSWSDGFVGGPRVSQSLDINISPGQTYTYSAGSSGTLIVSKQASHFQVSRTGLDQSGSLIYTYNPIAGYIGADEVTLAYTGSAPSEGSGGGCHNSSGSVSTSISIHFTVTSK